MSAQRKLIRKAAAAYLKNRTPAGANVFASRCAPLWDQEDSVELPAICVYSGREAITLFQESPRLYKRELELKVEIGANGETDNGEPSSDPDFLDDQLDDIGDAVERVIARSNRLTYRKEQTVADIVLSSETIEFSGSGRKTIGALVIVYTATYYTPEPDEYDSEPLDDLNTVHTDYDLNAQQQPADRASDTVRVRE